MTDYKPFWLRDMIVFGHGAPNRIKKINGQQGRCVCLWSEEKGFVRIYPVPYGYVHDWDIIDVEVRMPTNDRRENSYVVYNYENEWNNLSKRIFVHKEKNRNGKIVKKTIPRAQKIELARKLSKDVFSTIRDSKKSFGLIKPSALKLVLKSNREKSEGQTLLNCDEYLIMDQKDFAWMPYLEYSCDENCTSKHPHRQKIVEWGAYQFMRKNPNLREYCEKLSDNYYINDPNWEHYILIGNIRSYPTTYVVIKILRFKK